jgi:hypothetical protein
VSGSGALGAVSRSLVHLLKRKMQIDQLPVSLHSLDGPTDDVRLNLFLYRVDQHPQLRNADYRLMPGTADKLLAPPLPLILRYLVTAYAKLHDDTGDADAQAILGEAMRVFHQYPVVPTEDLQDDLPAAVEELRVTLVPLEHEEIGRLWTAANLPYRLSVCYEVSVIQIDPTPEDLTIEPRVRTVAVSEVHAPYQQPRLTGVSPLSGPVRTRLTITGEHLADWRTTVLLGGMKLRPEPGPTGDSVQVEVPAGLDPGFQQLQIDVGRLTRASWFFEVLP